MKIIISLTILFLTLIANVHAEKGTYDIVYIGEHNLNTVNTPNGTVTGGQLEGVFTVTSSNGKLYANGDNGKSTCIILSKKNKEKNNSNLEAICETND